MKATSLLRRQHRVLEDLLEKLSLPRTRKPPLLQALAARFAEHTSARMEQFYPAARAIDPARVMSGCEDLTLAGELIERLGAIDPGDAQFHGCVMSVKELIEQRIDEDERALFPAVEKRAAANDEPAAIDLRKAA